MPPPDILKHLKDKLRKAQTIWREHENGDLHFRMGAVVGNKVYAYRRERALDVIIDDIGFKQEDTTFITLTAPYWDTDWGRKQSWLCVIEALPKILRKLKKIGMTEYILVFEANRGGCHLHILAKWGIKLTFKKMGKVIRVVNPDIRKLLKENWIGHVDVRGMGDDNVKGYMKKYLGKFGHIEDALRRALRNWGKEGDEKKKTADVKML